MEDFIVERKADEELFYVVQMPEGLSSNGVILLANFVSGDFKAITVQVLMQEYSFHDLLENMDDDEDEGDDDSDEETPSDPVAQPQPAANNSFITS